jgi:hypothetical protein
MPIIDGFLVVDRSVPSFVLPIFIERHGSNQSLVQQINTEDKVASFLDVDVGNGCERTDHGSEVNIGELISYSSIGDRVQRTSPSVPRRAILLIPPSAGGRMPPKSMRPLVSISVINTEQSNLDAAVRRVNTLSNETIKVAIVTLPITFGTSRGHRLGLIELKALTPQFDYVFIVGNHVLQKPIGRAPRLSSLSRAVKYVKACIDALMQIVWVSRGPKSPANFYRMFPRKGFCLVGRGGGNKNQSTQDTLREAVSSALSTQLPLLTGKRIVVVAPPAIIDDEQTDKFLEEAATHSRRQTLAVQSTGSRLTATVLAFGVAPVEQNVGQYRQFILELLYSRRFNLLRETKRVMFGKFPRTSMIAFRPVSAESEIDDAISNVERTQAKGRCIITNFSPSGAWYEYCVRRNILAMHHSSLDEALLRGFTPKVASP